MITRIEIDGFKSFENFALDVPPFLVLIGTNAGGKSNLLDALSFLSRAAVHGLDSAVAAVRGDARGLFRRRGDGTQVDRMRFAVEFLLGLKRLPNRWRYEFDLAWTEPEDSLERIVVEGQRLIALSPAEDRWPEAVALAPEWYTEGWVTYPQRREVRLAPDLSQVPGVSSLLEMALTSSKDPDNSTIEDAGVVRQILIELNDVRFLHLEASSLRLSSEFGGPTLMDTSGRDLPNYLRYLGRSTRSEERPLGVIGEIKMHLVGLVREVSDFEIVEDKNRRDARLEFSSPYEQGIGAEFASAGTLRMLAILAVLHDEGVAAVEEPENGVFPERFRHLLALTAGLVTDVSEPPERDASGGPLPYRQAIFTSHSPIVLDEVPSANLAFLDMTTILENGVASRVTRVRRLREDQGPVRVDGERWPRVTESELSRFRAGVEASV
ncbi:AAA family ATPase [Sphaerisporangium sp. NPDC051017]|uniref:AAA family ATPase n=1 Tax=Sphaerisporangium sp. NPDC051017 TaxID=3154636 RepID=UPI003425ACDD